MKKSSFLHNPKDVLSKSFKPAKCKMALKLAASRMKLMKNKKEVQVKQMKRELAQLLESGQDQTARIRVEHVIREEKMMAAYELIDIYCELIVARLPIIESQKNCPIDLKEAIASVIFASPRCGDIPELVDVKKHFTAKYGKEFVNAAIELRPNCGVSRLLVEKLSAKAPDGQTKVKVLTEIAEEHNIKWDPKSLGQSDVLPPDDLLNGPNTFEKSSAVHAEAPPFVAPDLQAPPSHSKVQNNQPLNFSEQNVGSSEGTQNFASRHNSSSSGRVSSTPQAQMRPSGVEAERGEVRQSFQGDESTSFSGQSWNMDFKDAASAARAAAESAEQASMAARAAAELSSRGRIATQQQYSSEIHNSIDDVLRDDRTAKHATSKYTGDYLPKDSGNSSFLDRQSTFQNDQISKTEQDIGERLSEKSYQDSDYNGKRYGRIGSSTSEDSFLDHTFAQSVQTPDGNLQEKSSKEEENKVKMSMQKQSIESETEGTSHLQEDFGSEKFYHSEEERIRNQPSILSSSSHSSISDTDDIFSNSGHQMFRYDAGENPSVGFDEEHKATDSWQPSYHAAAAPVTFDDSGSDGDDVGFDTGFQHSEGSKFYFTSPGRNSPSHPGIQHSEESKFYFASPGRSSPSHPSTNTGSESLIFRTGKSPESSILEFPSKKDSFPEFSESLEAPVDGSQADNFGPVTFDDSDGSDIEIEMPHSGNHEIHDSRDLPTRQNQSLGFSDTEMHGNNSGTETVADSTEKFGFGESSASQSLSRLGKSRPDSSNASSESSFQNSVDEADYLGSSRSKLSMVHEVKDNVGSAHLHGTQMEDESSKDSKELNFKKLTGGFRQKGYTHPPYTRSELDDTSTFKRVSEGSPTMIHTRSELDDTSAFKRVSEGSPTMIQQSVASTFESFAESRKSKGGGSGRSSRVPHKDSDSDSDSSMEELKKQPASRRQEPIAQDAGKDIGKQSRLRGLVTYFDSESSDSEDDSAKQVFTGRRNLGTGFSRRTKASTSSSTSVSNSKANSSSAVPVNFESGTDRNPTTRFYDSKTRQETQSRTRNSEQPSSAKVPSNPGSVSKISLPKENKKSSGVEQPPPGSEQKVETSTENHKTPSGSTISREDSSQQASHVHPKLPDYDTLTARFQAFRMNRQ
ncbi:hypothetical protein ACH5RR_006104 [Cinchona calisaya]|uniref:Regulator of Vps4 activity in the MVB pathway protein n=1 Tax=Cinchona calisaya TaxID=153742 RepID=A0ABD3AN15_9GENT